ncbi:MAG: CPBP family glutamic-type intramembrane protease [Myxococcales bacterium]
MRHLRLAAVLGLTSGLTVVLLYPYLLVLIPQLATTKIPLWALVPIQAGQTALQLFLAAWAGLALGAQLGLDAPFLRALVDRTPPPEPPPRRQFGLAAIVGFCSGAALVALDRFVFMPHQPEAIRSLGAQIARWKGLLASFYGGIGEEVLTRLFLMTLFAWVLCRLLGGRRPAAFVAAAVFAALAFAAGHLPAAAQLAPLDAWVVTRVLVLNSVAGIAFGVLFWKRGLEHAMAAHFCADLVLHVLSP